MLQALRITEAKVRVIRKMTPGGTAGVFEWIARSDANNNIIEEHRPSIDTATASEDVVLKLPAVALNLVYKATLAWDLAGVRWQRTYMPELLHMAYEGSPVVEAHDNLKYLIRGLKYVAPKTCRASGPVMPEQLGEPLAQELVDLLVSCGATLETGMAATAVDGMGESFVDDIPIGGSDEAAVPIEFDGGEEP